MGRSAGGSSLSRRGVLVGAIGLGGLATGCGGSTPDSSGTPSSGGTPSGASSSASSSAAAGSTTAAPSGASSSTGSGGASVAPASGDSLMLTAFSFNLPQGWTVGDHKSVSANGFDPDLKNGEGEIEASDISGYSTDTIDSLAKSELKFNADVDKPVRGPNLVVGGVEGFTLTGSDARVKTYFHWGSTVDDRTVDISFLFLRETPDAQSVIDSVLASVTFG